jgi:predicted nucleic acid-binding protein
MTNNVYLLDSCVLIALADTNHTSHERCRAWFYRDMPFATCPITEGALFRHHIRLTDNATVVTAKLLLGKITSLPNHRFWPDDASYKDLAVKGVISHRQVTDAYLVLLAAKHGGIVATVDKGMAAIHPGVLLV